MDYVMGALLALGVGGLASLVGFDRERSFYPVVMVVIASYYGLFAAMAGSGAVFGSEALVMAVFVAVAVVGFRTNLWLVAAALLAHGVLDFVHHEVIANPGVPVWWPGFCLGYDAAAAGYLGVRLARSAQGRGFGALLVAGARYGR